MAKRKVDVSDKDVERYIEKKIEGWFSKLENLDCKRRKVKCTGSGGCTWFLGFVGAAIYFFQQGQGALGLLKAVV